LLYNLAHDIKVYRLTSKIVPLATHPEVLKWNYVDEFQELYSEIKKIIHENHFRISAHPDHFTILGSPKEEVVNTSISDLVYHNNIMNAIGLSSDYGKLVLHIGGKYEGKKETIVRFKKNFRLLDMNIANRLILENDDKIYNIHDVLNLCEELEVPMVLDIHHHWCNNNGQKLLDYLGPIFSTWDNQILKPKIHISSPKSEKDIRAHADNIDFDFFYEFITMAKMLDKDFDIMIEAKNKSLALFDLMTKIRKNNKFKIIDNSTFEM